MVIESDATFPLDAFRLVVGKVRMVYFKHERVVCGECLMQRAQQGGTEPLPAIWRKHSKIIDEPDRLIRRAAQKRICDLRLALAKQVGAV